MAVQCADAINCLQGACRFPLLVLYSSNCGDMATFRLYRPSYESAETDEVIQRGSMSSLGAQYGKSIE